MKVKYKNKYITLPDCIIVGAAKSGTTALFKYLSTYSQVCSSSIKEPWFFSHYNRDFIYIDPKTNNDLSDNIITDLLQYSNLFENSSENSCMLLQGRPTIPHKKIEPKKYVKNHVFSARNVVF